MASETNKPHKRSGAHFASSPSPVEDSAAASSADTPRRRRSHASSSRAVSAAPFASTSHRAAAGFGSGVSRSSAGLDEVSADTGAPRPIGVDPAATGAFKTLSAGQGAVITTRETAGAAASAARSNLESDSTSMRLTGGNAPRVNRRRAGLKTDKRLFLGLGIAAVVVIAILFVLFNNAYNSTSPTSSTTGESAQTQVAADQTISYGGYTVGLSRQADGKYALTRLAEGGDKPLVITELEGTPVSLVLYNGVYYVPENLDGTWDVICYVMGDGSIPTQLADSSGNPITGDGSLASVSLEGARLKLTDAQGKLTSTSLS